MWLNFIAQSFLSRNHNVHGLLAVGQFAVGQFAVGQFAVKKC